MRDSRHRVLGLARALRARPRPPIPKKGVRPPVTTFAPPGLPAFRSRRNPTATYRPAEPAARHRPLVGGLYSVAARQTIAPREGPALPASPHLTSYLPSARWLQRGRRSRRTRALERALTFRLAAAAAPQPLTSGGSSGVAALARRVLARMPSVLSARSIELFRARHSTFAPRVTDDFDRECRIVIVFVFAFQ